MGLLDNWTRINRQDKGLTASKNLGYKVQDGSSLSINIGGELDDEQNKTSYLESVRAGLNTETINKIIDTARKSVNINSFYNSLEEQGIELIYLIALDLDENGTIEEDIQSYQITKNKGLDVLGTATTDEDVLHGVSKEYIDKAISASYKLPTLKNKNGEEIQEIITGRQKIMENYDSTKFLELDNLRAENRELKEALETMQQAVEELKTGTLNDEEQEQVNINEADVLKELERTLLKAQKEMNLTTTTTAEKKAEKRLIYIVGKVSNKDIDLDDDKYIITVVTEVLELNVYAQNKKNLLVITNKIKESFMEEFVAWYQGILGDDDIYRIVTVEGSSLDIDGVEEEVQLTTASIDEYYATHPQEKYDKTTGMEDFRQIVR